MKKLFLMMLLVGTVSIVLTAKNKDSITPVDRATVAATDSLNATDTLDTGVIISGWEANENAREYSGSQLISNVSDKLVPLTGIVFIFGSPAVIVFIISYFQHKKRKAQYELIAKAIEAGKDIPEGILDSKNTEVKNNFTTGIINLFAGIGIAILLWNLVALKFASIGVLISCIGIGQIIIYFVMNKSKKGVKTEEAGENKQLTE